MAGVDGAQVEICRDRACGNVVLSFSATGSSGAPTSALEPGLYYWRARATVRGLTATAASVVWEFWVGARDAAVNTSWGTALDVNEDGYADLVVGAGGGNGSRGRLYVYPGNAGSLSTTPAAVLETTDEPDAEFGEAVSSAGDVNGDGFADVVVGGPFANHESGDAHVYLGSAGGLQATPIRTLTGPGVADAHFGESVASAGDVNGDGYADVIIGSAGTRHAYLYLGGRDGLSSPVMLSPPAGDNWDYGNSVAGAGDLNGDGYADVAVAARHANGATGRLFVYFGSAAGLGLTTSATLNGPDALGEFGTSVAAGDFNGDGYADLAVTAHAVSQSSSRVYVYAGGQGGVASAPGTILAGVDGAMNFGWYVADANDVDGDGFDDLVGCARYLFENGAFLYFGAAGGLGTTRSIGLGPPGYGEVASITGAGDLNGDGFSDVAVATPAVGASGRVYVYDGVRNGFGGTAPLTLMGPGSVEEAFGASVAIASDPSQRASALRL